MNWNKSLDGAFDDTLGGAGDGAWKKLITKIE